MIQNPAKIPNSVLNCTCHQEDPPTSWLKAPLPVPLFSQWALLLFLCFWVAFSFLLPPLLTKLHCTDKAGGHKLKGALAVSSAFISPRLTIHTSALCALVRQAGTALAQASAVKGCLGLPSQLYHAFLVYLRKRYMIKNPLFNSQHTIFSTSFSSVGWFLTPCYAQAKLIGLLLW